MSSNPVGALPTMLETLAALPATFNLQQAATDDPDLFIDFREIRDELRPTLGGGLSALCLLVEEASPAAMALLEPDASLLGSVWRELIGLDAWLDHVMAIEDVSGSPWSDYRRHVMPLPADATPHLVQLLNGLAATEMDDCGQLIADDAACLTAHADAVRWRMLAPAAALVGILLATKPFHPPAITGRLPAMAAFVRECHAGMAWLDALPQRLTQAQGGQDVALSA